MYLLIFTLMTICSIKGLLTIRWEKLLRYMVLTAVIVFGTIITTRIFFTKALEFEYTKYQSFVEMELFNDPVPTKVHKALPAVSPPQGDQASSRLDEIVRRGSLRVGYFKDSLPFAFTNKADNLVGFDIEMAHLLARDLSVSLELVLIERERAVEMLNTGYCDIIMSGSAITPQKLRGAAFSEPYLDTTIAFIVRDYRRDKFNSRKAIQSLDAPRIGVPNLPYYIAKLKQYLPQAHIVPLSSPREFFRTDHEKIDAFLFTAEAGSAWTLVYPEYAVAVPLPDVIKVPLAYSMARGDREIIDFINGWIDLKKKDETIDKLYDHWILGRGSEKKEPRWSIIRNVLHWVE
jgi:ABC-type amino acid transport substrate-binding protein